MWWQGRGNSGGSWPPAFSHSLPRVSSSFGSNCVSVNPGEILYIMDKGFTLHFTDVNKYSFKTLYNIHYTVHTFSYFTIYIIQSTLSHTLQYTLYSPHFLILYNIHYTVHIFSYFTIYII